MKKTIISIFLITTLLHSFGRNNQPTGDGTTNFSVLVVNARVTVILVNHENATLRTAGNSSIDKYISFQKNGDTLVINSSRTRDMRDAGIVYVPARMLRNIQINTEANVRSLYALNVPQLDVIINGNCSVAVSNIGKVNFIGTSAFDVEQSTEVRPFPKIF